MASAPFTTLKMMFGPSFEDRTNPAMLGERLLTSALPTDSTSSGVKIRSAPRATNSSLEVTLTLSSVKPT